MAVLQRIDCSMFSRKNWTQFKDSLVVITDYLIIKLEIREIRGTTKRSFVTDLDLETLSQCAEKRKGSNIKSYLVRFKDTR